MKTNAIEKTARGRRRTLARLCTLGLLLLCANAFAASGAAPAASAPAPTRPAVAPILSPAPAAKISIPVAPPVKVRMPVKIEALNVLTALGDKAHFRAKVTDSKGQPVAAALVDFYVVDEGQDKGVGSGQTGTDGAAEAFVQKPIAHVMPGTFVVKAKVSGKSSNPASAGFVPTEATSNLTVIKSQVGLLVSGAAFGANKVKVHVHLTRKTDGEGINGRPVKLTVFGKTVEQMTNANGAVSMELDTGANNPAKGFTVKAVFEGDDFYLAGGETHQQFNSIPTNNVKITVFSSAYQAAPGEALEFSALVEDLDTNPPTPLKDVWVWVSIKLAIVGGFNGWATIGAGITDATGKTKPSHSTAWYAPPGSYPVGITWRPKDKAYLSPTGPKVLAFGGGFTGQVVVTSPAAK